MKKVDLLFLDTEFTGLHQQTSLISLALVPMDGPYFYAEFTDYKVQQIDDWLQQNVLANLYLDSVENELVKTNEYWQIKGDTISIQKYLEAYLTLFDNIKIWADCPAYDWVLFCNLFGGALKIPNNIHYMPMDFATALYVRGYKPDEDRLKWLEKPSRIQFKKHNALGDAMVLKECYLKLNKLNETKRD